MRSNDEVGCTNRLNVSGSRFLGTLLPTLHNRLGVRQLEALDEIRSEGLLTGGQSVRTNQATEEMRLNGLYNPETRIVRSLKNIVIWLYNVLYNWIPFFTLKRLVLRMGGVKIGRGSVIHTPVRFLGMGRIEIGDHSVINFGCFLDNRVGIRIGDNVSVSHGTRIYSLGHDVDDPFFATKGQRVTIGNYACVFSNVLIMPGVTLSQGSVVYAGSVVTKNVGEYHIVGGNPARFIRKRSTDLRYTLRYDQWFAV